MDQPGHEVEPHFSQPVQQIIQMLIVIGLVAAGGYFAFPRVAPVFLSNPYLNGVILAVFLMGVFACFWQVFQLTSSVRWIVGFAAGRPGHEFVKAPRLLAPLASLFRSNERRMQISPSSSRSILDSVAQRIDELRDITRYITNLLIFLGLLGTFYGLATTVPAVVETIRALAPNDNETGMEVFARLMSGLETQLGGMGTAFSSSLLGLFGSLVVGLLELFASHGQNRFYRELEEWISSITRLSFAGGDGDSGGETSGVGAMLDHMSEQMTILQDLVARSEAGRAGVDERLSALAISVNHLTDRLASEANTADALNNVAQGQERLITILERRSTDSGGATGGEYTDAESRMRLRSIDVQLLRILEEITAGRQETVSDLRTDLAQLTRTLRQMNLDPRDTTGRRG